MSKLNIEAEWFAAKVYRVVMRVDRPTSRISRAGLRKKVAFVVSVIDHDKEYGPPMIDYITDSMCEALNVTK